MSNRVLDFIIRAKDDTGPGIDKASGRFVKFRSRVNKWGIDAAKRIFSVRTAVIAFTAVTAALGLALKTAFEFERYQTQFKVLFGDLEKAKRHMVELQDFAASTSFTFQDLAPASRTLHIFTGGVMGATESLKLVGDAAAAVGVPIGELSTWVGRAYAAIKGGKPFGEAAMRLMELGVLTPEVRGEMEDLQKAGADNIEVWDKLVVSLKKYEGAMKESSTTGEGLISTMKDNWTLAVAEFGSVFMDVAKDDIGAIIEKLGKLRENGDIAVWADRAIRVLATVRESVGFVTKSLSAIYKWSGASDAVSSIKAISAAAGALSTGDIAGAGSAFHKERVKGNYGGLAQKALGDPFGVLAEIEADRAETAVREAKIRKKAQERNAKARPESDESLGERVTKDLLEAQKKVDVDTAKKKADEELKERAKTEKIIAKEQAKTMRSLIAEERRLRRQMITEQASDLRKAISDARGQQGQVMSQLERARSEASQAWAWYRDPESFKAQRAEEGAEADAKEQFTEDAARLKRRHKWRSRDLGDDQEAVRRVILAREKEAIAERSLIAIEKNTNEMAKKLEELMRAK